MKHCVTRMGVILDKNLNGVEFLPILLAVLAKMANTAQPKQAPKSQIYRII